MQIGYYPGCSLSGTAIEYNKSLTGIAPLLGFDLVEVPDWNCCGASSAHAL
ncbi:MAG: heterodisulfide reductase subunit B, partial [Deltaproteobacteria bacterium]|nr:heterodisulfide reductase subunit B [Deltaproteobacteria bacterium]